MDSRRGEVRGIPVMIPIKWLARPPAAALRHRDDV
jgi:hypothetical protein